MKIGDDRVTGIGALGLLDFSVDLAMDGETLTEKDRKQLLAAIDGLMLLRGKWVEVNREQLQEALAQWQQLQREPSGVSGCSLGDGTGRHAARSKKKANSN